MTSIFKISVNMKHIKLNRYFSYRKFIKNRKKTDKSKPTRNIPRKFELPPENPKDNPTYNIIKEKLKPIEIEKLLDFKDLSTTTQFAGKKMDALKYYAKDKKLKHEQHDIPDSDSLADDEVLVQVHYAGICGTDLHIIDGHFPCSEDGLVLGHEFSGVIVDTGKNVRTVEVGDRVCADPNMGCAKCKFCRTGRPHYCQSGGLASTLGIFRCGGWRQFAVVPEVSIHKVPKTLTMEQAALVEPMSCLTHAWTRIRPLPVGSRVLILGSGIIGNLFISLLHHQGHKRVMISEPSEKRQQLIENLCTGYEVVKPEELKEKQKKDPNLLFDLVFDASGKASAIEHAFTMLNFGGKMCVFGVSNPKDRIKISPFRMFEKELTITGALINPLSFPKAIKLIETMGCRYIDYEKLGVQVFKISEFKDAIKCLRKGDIAKATFKFV